jgi:integrase
MSVSIPSNSRFYHYRFMLNGRIYTGSTKTANKAAALRYEASIRTEAHANVMLGDPERITLKDAFQKYLDTKKKLTSYNDYLTRTNKQLGITKTKDRQDATVFGFSPDKFLDTLKTSDMQHLIIERGNEGIQSSTLVHEIGIWAGMVTLMKRLGYKVPTIDFIHLRADNGVKPNKGNVRYLTVDEEQKLLWALDPKQKWPRQTTYEEMPEQMKRDKQDIFDLVILLLETGARYTEIAELKWCNVNILAQTLTLYRPKVKNVSTLELSNRAYDVLLRRFNDPQRNEWVFTNEIAQKRGLWFISRRCASSCATT